MLDTLCHLSISISIYRHIDIQLYRYTDISTYRYIDISIYPPFSDVSICRHINIPIHRHTDISTYPPKYRNTDISSKTHGIKYNTFRARGHLVSLVPFPFLAPNAQKAHKSGKVLGPPVAARRARQHSLKSSIWASPWEPCPGPLHSDF